MFRIFSKLLSASGSGRVKNVHRLTLLVNDVRNRSRYIFLFPEISRTTMARPALAIRRVETGPIQRSACITVEAVHHNFWSDAGSDYCMHVVWSERARRTASSRDGNMPHPSPARRAHGGGHRAGTALDPSALSRQKLCFHPPRASGSQEGCANDQRIQFHRRAGVFRSM